MHRYYDRFSWLGVIRVFFIVPSFVLTWMLLYTRNESDIFPTYIPKSTPNGNNTALVLPAACMLGHPGISQTQHYHNFTASMYWNTWFVSTTNSSQNNSSSVPMNSTLLTNHTVPAYSNFSSDDTLKDLRNMYAFGFLTAAFAVTSFLSVFQKCVHKRIKNHKQIKRNLHRVAVILKILAWLTCAVIAIWSYTRFCGLRNWMQNSDWLREDRSERSADSFGQLVPLILLALPFLTVFEQCVGEYPSFFVKLMLRLISASAAAQKGLKVQ